jgi:hypothetical protein
VEKPGVRVREDVREDFYLRPYWRFDDPYALQPGMGPDGDRPNDYKFLFAGAVVRDPSQGVARTGAYASLWIDRPAGDLAASRVGSAFDPQAPPLFSFPSGPVRAFYDPTGTRPGSLLVQGDVADFGGYVMPLGPQKLWINVTSPAGKVRSFATQANAWGFVHDPALNFVVGEPGVWHADVHVLACPPAADAAWPCQGGAMDDGTTGYAFYVASPGVAPLRVRAPAWLPAGGDMQLPAPEALAGGHATAWMPGWTLDARSVGPDAPVVGYHPQQIAARVPNFDPQGWKPGAPADRVAFTAVAKDADGAWRGLALDAWGARVLAP